MQSEESAVSPDAPPAPIETEAAATATGAVTLSDTSRLLTRVMAVLFALLGLGLFVASGWVSANFLWKAPPFAVMTMGAWYLGNAFVAWEVARVWRWSVVYPTMIFLWAFSLLEAGVLLVHSNLLHLDAQFGWPYLVVIVVAVLAALYGIYDWLRIRPRAGSWGSSASPNSGRRKALTPLMRQTLVLFVILVFVIAIFPLLGLGKHRQVFPEELTVFTLNAFGAFYLALVIGRAGPLRGEERAAFPLLCEGGRGAHLYHHAGGDH